MRFGRLLSVCLLTAGLSAQEKLKQDYDAAQQLFLKGDDAGAAPAFRALLVGTLRERASLYRQQGSWSRVRDDLSAAREIDPASTGIRYDLAFAQFRLGMLRDAVRSLEQLVRENPNEARFHGLLGRAYLSLGKSGAGRGELTSALRLEPDDAMTSYTLALAALADKDRETAARVFTDLARRQNASAGFHLLVGRAYLDGGYQAEAQKELLESLRLDPKIRFARYLLALSYLRAGETAAIQQAKPELSRELELYPDEFAARYLLGLLLEQERRWQQAADEFQQAARISPREPDPHFHLGAVFLKLGRAADAADALRRAIELAPDGSTPRFRISRAHYLLSQAYKALGDVNAVAREAERARQTSADATKADQKLLGASPLTEELGTMKTPDIQVSWQDLTAPAALTKEQQEMLTIYGDVLANARNYLGLIAGRRQRFNDAAREFAALRSSRPDFPEVDFNLGLALFEAEKYAEALEPLERASRLSHKPAAAKILGLAYFRIGRYAQAALQLEGARPSHKDDAQLLVALGTSLARSGRRDEARRVFEDLLKSQPDSAPLHVMWGEAYAQQSQPAEAEKEFRRALELDSRAATAHFHLGMLRLRAGTMAEAEREFRAEIANYPQDARARYHLAFVLLSQQKTDQAIPLLRDVIAAQPDYAEAHYTLGKALLQQQAVDEATKELEAAVALDASKPHMHYQLGRAYMQLGRRDEAQREFQLSEKLKKQ